MTVGEDRAHFSMWCMLAAPLMAGNDISNMTKETHEILTSKEAIAIDQDPLGIQGFEFSSKDSLETWFKPLQNGDWAVCFLNRSKMPVKIDFDWSNEMVKDTIFNYDTNFDKEIYKVRNIWAKKDIGTTKKAFKSEVPAHDVVLLRLSKKPASK